MSACHVADPFHAIDHDTSMIDEPAKDEHIET